ncbi:Transmembrane protein [Globisporangium polare]
MNPASNIVERLSSTSQTKALLGAVANTATTNDKYNEVKTPDPGFIEGGAIRAGGAPNLYSKANIGVLAQYAATGIVYGSLLGVVYPFLNNYLHMSGTETASANALLSIPWTWRMFFGGVSDCFPIFGYRRRPYILAGWLITFVACFVMAVIPIGDSYYSDPSVMYTPEADLTPEQLAGLNKDAPGSGVKYILLLVLANIGVVLAGSVADGVLAELAQREPENTRGTAQTMSYAVQNLFSCLSSAMIGFGLNDAQYGGDFSVSMGFNAVMGVCAFFSLAILPMSWYCITEEKGGAQSGRKYVSEMYDLITHRVMYQIIAFRFFRNMFGWVASTAAYPVQSTWAKVTPVNSSVASIIGYVVSAGALYAAKKYSLNWNWRWMIVATQFSVVVIDAIPSFFTIYDVYRSQWFWLGVPIVEYLPYFAGYTISTLAVVEIIEIGNEGGVYGLLMTVENVAYPFASVVSKNICANFDIGYDFLQVDDSYARNQVAYTYMISYGFKLFGLVFVLLLPKQKAETQELKRTGGKSKLMGNITIGYIAFAFFWSLMTNLMTFSSSTACLKIAGGDGC